MKPKLLVSATRALKAKTERGEFTGNATMCSPVPPIIYHLVIIQKQFEKRFAKTVWKRVHFGKRAGNKEVLCFAFVSFIAFYICLIQHINKYSVITCILVFYDDIILRDISRYLIM